MIRVSTIGEMIDAAKMIESDGIRSFIIYNMFLWNFRTRVVGRGG